MANAFFAGLLMQNIRQTKLLDPICRIKRCALKPPRILKIKEAVQLQGILDPNSFFCM